MDWDPIVIGVGLIGSSVVGAMTYSFHTGAAHKEVLLKIEFLKDTISEMKARMDSAERRQQYDGMYVTRSRRPSDED